MRILKEPEERRNEILDAAERLFQAKGYERATIQDILQEVGIAKGTFYYYFKSKEEVLDAIVDRYVEKGVKAATAIAADDRLTVHEKLLHIMLAQKHGSDGEPYLVEELHHIRNAQLHQKSLSETVLRLTPVLQEVIEQGIREGEFTTPYPRESIELLLVAAVTMFDEGIFPWRPDELTAKINGFIYAMETLLGAKPGSLAYIAGLLSQTDTPENERHEP
ncbi:transcriptional regulator, TetR family [Paenibacillus sp. UNCCL117]|uniref:TetR/AcrR family transcriptional regulator n=1 Tax=unclassified Paenibacillus TaxID=185978 RepID=UPI00088034FC|nr:MULTISPECIES: TetR/AcrR family transcriptional regulator [unclassified Paenibacillus]SDE20174.1 DNA-binding transcriptional regulator, AcrR family [Paenibacillus sp. cl123]SFW61835.1 transcriptional regulator, TetR family [Paenibacillus sp. UNCCL117]